MAPRIERFEGWWRWVGGPVPRGSAAITLGPLVIVRERAAGDPHLLRHELVHVEQWRTMEDEAIIEAVDTSYELVVAGLPRSRRPRS